MENNLMEQVFAVEIVRLVKSADSFDEGVGFVLRELQRYRTVAYPRMKRVTPMSLEEFSNWVENQKELDKCRNRKT